MTRLSRRLINGTESTKCGSLTTHRGKLHLAQRMTPVLRK